MNAETNKIIIETLLPFKPKQICVFGSYARGEMTDDSDIDIFIDLDKDFSLLNLGGAYMDLQDSLKRKVDLILKGSLSPIFRTFIETDLISIYNEK